MSDSCPTAPSSASICALLDGDDGAVPKFLTHWVLRAVLVAPGFVLAGVRGSRLISGPLASSTLISIFLLLYTAVERGKADSRRGGLRRNTSLAKQQRRRPLQLQAKMRRSRRSDRQRQLHRSRR